MNIEKIIEKSRNIEPLSRDELIWMLALPSDSPESFRIMAEANRISKELAGGKAEVHAQFALNLAPCASNCKFCSFAVSNRVFTREQRVGPEEAVAMAKQFEAEGANAVFVMTTAGYSFADFLDISRDIRGSLKPETTLIANVGDSSPDQAGMIKNAGYQGVYHALRLREGIDSNLHPDQRKMSIRNFIDAGLKVGTCVEPIGPEHTNEELADMILFTASFNPAFSGAARRIAIPGTELAALGMITELRMAQIVAVTRLAVPRSVMGNCTHEPCTLGGIAGANLFWAELGANPRDTRERTEEGRGHTVRRCKDFLHECGWSIWEGPSRYYSECNRKGASRASF